MPQCIMSIPFLAQLHQMPFDARPGGAALQEATGAIPAKALLDGGETSIQPALSAGPGEEAPAPALLVYLALILAGSGVAIGLARRSFRQET
jgi:hypothetical protein